MFSIINVLGSAFLLIIFGGLSGVLVNNGYLSINVIEQLSTGLTLIVCLLNEKEYKYLLPLCPTIPRTTVASYKVADNIFTPENLMLILVLLPCYLFADAFENSITLYTVLSLFSVNAILRLTATIVSTQSFRTGFLRPALLCISTMYCIALVFFHTDEFTSSLFQTENIWVSVALAGVLIFVVVVGYRIFRRSNIYGPLKSGHNVHAVLGKYSVNLFRNIFMIVIRQYLKCPVYKTVYASSFAIAFLGIFLFKIDGAEYIGASLLVGLYTLSFMQYSTSFLSLSPEAFYSSPTPYRFFIYPFVVINSAVTTLMAVGVSLYIKFILCKSILPIISIWAIMNGPVSQVILLGSLSPVRFDLWSGNFHVDRPPVRVVISGVSDLLLFIAAFFIQIKTVTASVVLGILSFVSILFYHKYIDFLEYWLYKRKYNMIKTLKK